MAATPEPWGPRPRTTPTLRSVQGLSVTRWPLSLYVLQKELILKVVLMKGCSLDMFLQEFVITSPDFEAAKFWVGNLGKTATHAVVYAQLYTPDHVCHGLHSFIVPVRPGPLAPHTVVSGVQILYLIVFRCAPGEGSIPRRCWPCLGSWSETWAKRLARMD